MWYIFKTTWKVRAILSSLFYRWKARAQTEHCCLTTFLLLVSLPLAVPGYVLLSIQPFEQLLLHEGSQRLWSCHRRSRPGGLAGCITMVLTALMYVQMKTVNMQEMCIHLKLEHSKLEHSKPDAGSLYSWAVIIHVGENRLYTSER